LTIIPFAQEECATFRWGAARALPLARFICRSSGASGINWRTYCKTTEMLQDLLALSDTKPQYVAPKTDFIPKDDAPSFADVLQDTRHPTSTKLAPTKPASRNERTDSDATEKSAVQEHEDTTPSSADAPEKNAAPCLKEAPKTFTKKTTSSPEANTQEEEQTNAKTDDTTAAVVPAQPPAPAPQPIATTLQTLIDALQQKADATQSPLSDSAAETAVNSLVSKLQTLESTICSNSTQDTPTTEALTQFINALSPQEKQALIDTLNTLKAAQLLAQSSTTPLPSTASEKQQPLADPLNTLKAVFPIEQKPITQFITDAAQNTPNTAFVAQPQNTTLQTAPVETSDNASKATPLNQEAELLSALQQFIEEMNKAEPSQKTEVTGATTETKPTPLATLLPVTAPIIPENSTPVPASSLEIGEKSTVKPTKSSPAPATTTQPNTQQEQPSSAATKAVTAQDMAEKPLSNTEKPKEAFNASLLHAQNDNKDSVAKVLSSTDNTPQQLPQLQTTAAGQNVKAAVPQDLATKLPTTSPVVEQISLQMRKAVDDGISRIRIKMQPASLGAIDIKMDVAADGTVKAVLGVEKHETYEWLQKDFRHLERVLQDTGLKTDANSLSFQYRGGNGHGQQSGQQQSFGNSHYNPEKETFLEAKISLLGDAPTIRAPKQGLDIKV
jgi:flagellar hook-length control protein FliK